MKSSKIPFLFLLFIVACGTSTEPIVVKMFPEIKSLKTAKINYNGFLGNPRQLILVDDTLLLIADSYDNHLVSIYDLKNEHLLCRAFTEGRGHGELQSPIRIGYDFMDKRIQVLQRKLGTFTEYDIATLINGNMLPIKERNGVFPTNSLTSLGENNYIVKGLYGDNRYALFDDKGNKKMEFCLYTPELQALKNEYLKSMGAADFLVKNNTGTRIAIAGTYNDYIEFFEMRESEMKSLKRYYSIPADLHGEISGGGMHSMRINPDCGIHYITGYSTNNFVYFLYNGDSYIVNNERTMNGKYILKYDWEGNPIAAYNISNNKIVTGIAGNDEVIYLISQDPDTNEIHILSAKLL